jgi:pimeloyl-ACP methyl ester carboxylesterase
MEASSTPPFGAFVDVLGRRLFWDRRGSGSPTVVILPGAGLTGSDYLPIHEKVAEKTTSIVYDRAGTGWSDSVTLPRTAAAVTDELHALLEAAGADGVILVGHSLGGLYARNYATRFPDAVQGLVLLDPAHEDYDAHMPAELAASSTWYFDALGAVVDAFQRTPPTRALLQTLPPIRNYQRIYRKLFTQVMADWPPRVRDALVDRHASVDWLAVGLRESRHVDRLYDEMRAAGPLPDIPVVIFASTGTDAFQEAVAGTMPEQLRQAEVHGRFTLYTEWAASIPRAEVRSVDAGHVTLPFRFAQEITAATLELVPDVGTNEGRILH